MRSRWPRSLAAQVLPQRRARAETQRLERLNLDLTYSLPRDGEGLSDLLQRVLFPRAEAEAHLDDLTLSWLERGEKTAGVLGEARSDGGLERRERALVFDE